MARLQPFYEIPSNQWVLAGESAHDEKEIIRQWVLRELIRTYQYPEE